MNWHMTRLGFSPADLDQARIRAGLKPLSKAATQPGEKDQSGNNWQIAGGNLGSAIGGTAAIGFGKRPAQWVQRHTEKRVKAYTAWGLKRGDAAFGATPNRLGPASLAQHRAFRAQARGAGALAGVVAGGAARAGAALAGSIAGDAIGDRAAGQTHSVLTGQNRTPDRRNTSGTGVIYGALAANAAQGVISSRRKYRYKPRARNAIGIGVGAAAGAAAEWLGNKSAEKTRNALMTKFAPGGSLSEAEHAQRVAAGKASAEKRRNRGKLYGQDDGSAPGVRQASWGQGSDEPSRKLPGGPSTRGTASMYGQYRADPNDREWRHLGNEAPAQESAMGGTFALQSFTPRMSSEHGAEKSMELAQWAGKRTAEARKEVLMRGTERRLIPAHAGERDVRAAFNHARNIALHDVGLGDYQFRFNPEARARFDELVPFIKYARRKLGGIMREERPGEWAAYRREHGKPLPGGAVHLKDTNGQKAGDPKLVFYRHNELVKRAAAAMHLAHSEGERP